MLHTPVAKVDIHDIWKCTIYITFPWHLSYWKSKPWPCLFFCLEWMSHCWFFKVCLKQWYLDIEITKSKQWYIRIKYIQFYLNFVLYRFCLSKGVNPIRFFLLDSMHYSPLKYRLCHSILKKDNYATYPQMCWPEFNQRIYLSVVSSYLCL